jgi:hypothetical protein
MSFMSVAKLLVVKTQQPVEKPLYTPSDPPFKDSKTPPLPCFGLDV